MSLDSKPRGAAKKERLDTLPLLRRVIGEFVHPCSGSLDRVFDAHNAELLRERGVYALQLLADEPSLRAVQAS